MPHPDVHIHSGSDLNHVELTGKLADDPQVLWAHEDLWVGFLLSVRGGWLLTLEGQQWIPVYLIKGVAMGACAQQLRSWTCGTDVAVSGALDLIVGGDGVVRPRWELAVRAHRVERLPTGA